ncbi:hypothetical protein Salat_2503900 [Sesamum alatum]|uniref:Uncharacterized protein n=1 Tax=Sesamum alatum TaxID=300844 RepID=A0AAE1XRP1_9LAMI|nr:hypothetical protein Salat_2503900 [Sesamum alatum]
METLPSLLPLPGPGVLGADAVSPAAVPPLLGSDWAALAGPPHLLRVGGPTPAASTGSSTQRRCHKLTLGLATERLRQLKVRLSSGGVVDEMGRSWRFINQSRRRAIFR